MLLVVTGRTVWLAHMAGGYDEEDVVPGIALPCWRFCRSSGLAGRVARAPCSPPGYRDGEVYGDMYGDAAGGLSA